MHTTPDQRLLEFIRKFRVDLTPEGTITRLELYHSIEGSMGERLATFEMADRDEDEDPDDLAQEIWDEAEADSATRPTGSVERYVIQAFRGDTREPDEQKSFTCRGKLVTGLIGSGSEPPTPAGERWAEMRRTNDLHALVVRMCEATAGSAAVQLERERQENNRLREVAFEYEKLRQQLLDSSLDREIKRKEAEASSQQTQMLMQALFQLAPLVLKRLLLTTAPSGAALPLQPAPAPSPPPPPGPSPAAPAPAHVEVRDAMIAKLLETFTMEQMQTMLGAFDANQKQQFLAVYTSFREHPPTPSAAASESSQGAPSTN
jgi:hypothetical protein